MGRTVSKIIRKVRQLERERARLLDALLVGEPLLKGSLSLVKRTCGKASCHCAQRPGHEVWVLATTQEARRRCQVVRQADVEEIRRRSAVYKGFWAALRRLDAIGKEEKVLLRGLIAERDLPYA